MIYSAFDLLILLADVLAPATTVDTSLPLQFALFIFSGGSCCDFVLLGENEELEWVEVLTPTAW